MLLQRRLYCRACTCERVTRHVVCGASARCGVRCEPDARVQEQGREPHDPLVVATGFVVLARRTTVCVCEQNMRAALCQHHRSTRHARRRNALAAWLYSYPGPPDYEQFIGTAFISILEGGKARRAAERQFWP